VLTQLNGVPVLVKDVARVQVGYVPRLGIAGRDHDDDVVAAIVVMSRTEHTNDVLPRIKAEVTGIGLFLVTTVLQLHGGDIRVESEEGRGARVTAILPEMLREAVC